MTLTSVRRALLALALAFASLPGVMSAQGTGGTVRGRVTDATSGRPLADAQVVVAGTRIGGITSSTGEFTLTGVPTGARSVTVRRIGYQPVTQAVNVDASATATVDVRLTVSAVNLTDVVVTGPVRRPSDEKSAPALDRSIPR